MKQTPLSLKKTFAFLFDERRNSFQPL